MEDKDILDNWEDADDYDFEKKMTEREEKYKEKERKKQKRSKIKQISSPHSTQAQGEAAKSPAEENIPKFKILKRNLSDDNRIDLRNEQKLDALNKQNFQERLQNKEATYAEARARVFGQEPTSIHSQPRSSHDTHKVKIKSKVKDTK